MGQSHARRLTRPELDLALQLLRDRHSPRSKPLRSASFRLERVWAGRLQSA